MTVIIPITEDSPPLAIGPLSPGQLLSARERGAVAFIDDVGVVVHAEFIEGGVLAVDQKPMQIPKQITAKLHRGSNVYPLIEVV